MEMKMRMKLIEMETEKRAKKDAKIKKNQKKDNDI